MQRDRDRRGDAISPGLAEHLRGLADELLVKEFPGATLKTTAAAADVLIESVVAGAPETISTALAACDRLAAADDESAIARPSVSRPQRPRLVRVEPRERQARHGGNSPAVRQNIRARGPAGHERLRWEIATAAGLDLLAYFLSMATAEADVFVRSNAQADDATDLQSQTET